jgi:hypothetical protein
VNVGGDPERDDFGLPPADIEVPDDARELDRDVQAYHRELRALRRRQRWGSLRRPLRRDGMVLPLLAGCLILALLTGTLLTLFAAGQADQLQTPGSRPTAGATATTGNSTLRARPAVSSRNMLPNVSIITVSEQVVPLDTLSSAALILVPDNCQCGSTLQGLVSQAHQAGVQLYMISSAGEAGLQRLVQVAVNLAGEDPTQIGYVKTNILDKTYKAAGMTAILVNAEGSVTDVRHHLTRGALLLAQFRTLVPAS